MANSQKEQDLSTSEIFREQNITQMHLKNQDTIFGCFDDDDEQNFSKQNIDSINNVLHHKKGRKNKFKR